MDKRKNLLDIADRYRKGKDEWGEPGDPYWIWPKDIKFLLIAAGLTEEEIEGECLPVGVAVRA